MSYVITLVASDVEQFPVTDEHCKTMSKILEGQDNRITCEPVWLEPQKAVDLGIDTPLNAREMSELRQNLKEDRIDIFCTEIETRRKKLLVSDMDSTIVRGETLDDLAGEIGLKHKVAEITARTMNGEIKFEDSLRERVKLLKGMTMSDLAKTAESIDLNPGAYELVTTMRATGAVCVLVTGGFTCFADRAARMAGFHKFHGNIFDVQKEKLTGDVLDPVLNNLAKLHFMQNYMREHSIEASQVMAIGDGANDLQMLEAAGFGVGYRPKEILEKKLVNLIIFGDLTAALYAQGYTSQHISNGVKMMGR